MFDSFSALHELGSPKQSDKELSHLTISFELIKSSGQMSRKSVMLMFVGQNTEIHHSIEFFLFRTCGNGIRQELLAQFRMPFL